MKGFDEEEDFHSQDKKQSRKERRLAQKTDRSKFKKSDQEALVVPPSNTSLPLGRVLSITGEGSLVEHSGSCFLCSLKGALKKEKTLSKNLLAVGDWVRFSPLPNQEGAIASVEPRKSSLSRTDITGKKEQLIATNIDQAIITVSIQDPPLKPALIDRYLIAAKKGNLHPVLVINKLDLLERCSEGERELYEMFLSAYEPLGYPVLSVSTWSGVGVEALRALLSHKTSVFSGQSGVGKSSLLNACFGLTLKTGDLAVKTQKGSHTTTTAELLPLPGGGYCVDTPGIRSFGIWNLKKEEVLAHFEDLLGRDSCRFPDCMHREEPGCAVLHRLEEGAVSPLRYASYRTLIEEALAPVKPTTWS